MSDPSRLTGRESLAFGPTLRFRGQNIQTLVSGDFDPNTNGLPSDTEYPSRFQLGHPIPNGLNGPPAELLLRGGGQRSGILVLHEDSLSYQIPNCNLFIALINKYTHDSFGVAIITNPPGAAWILQNVSIHNDNQAVVSYFNPEKSIFYIDIYDLDLNLLSRYKLLNIIADISKGDYAYQIMVDNENNLYAMVISKNDYPQLVKYKLFFDQKIF